MQRVTEDSLVVEPPTQRIVGGVMNEYKLCVCVRDATGAKPLVKQYEYQQIAGMEAKLSDHFKSIVWES